MTDPNRREPQGFEPLEPAVPLTTSQDSSRTMAQDPTQRPGWERATLEKLAFASLNEQKATRRWKTFVRLGWLAFFVFLAWFAFSRSTPSTRPTMRKFSVSSCATSIVLNFGFSAFSWIRCPVLTKRFTVASSPRRATTTSPPATNVWGWKRT